MNQDPDCIFCRIIAGQIPSTKIYEDENTLAFLDIGPLVKGHTLVIPKAHHSLLMESPDDVLKQVIVAVRRVAAALVKGLGADGVNIHQANGTSAGQVVPHLHVHVVPRYEGDGHHWNWKVREYASTQEMLKLAAQIKAQI